LNSSDLRAPSFQRFLRQTLPVAACVVALGCLFGLSLPASSLTAPLLVAAYNFNEGTGSLLTDVSGQNNHGTLTNGPVWAAAGKYGGALTFDGKNDLVSIGDHSSLDLTSQLTVEAWVKSDRSRGRGPVVFKAAISSDRDRRHNKPDISYALFTNQLLDRPGLIIGADSRLYVAKSHTHVSAGSWTHLSGTYDGTMARLYLNGVQVASRKVRGIPEASGPLSIGGSSIWGEYFKGQIDDVRIYRGVRTAAQIQVDMRTPVAAPVVADVVPPVVSMTAPSDGATVAGTVAVSADASDNVGVVSVQFLRDGTDFGAADTSAPYGVEWDTTTAAEGLLTLAARAVDAAGNSTMSTAVRVTVRNVPPPQPARLVITEPANNSTLSGPAVTVTYATVGDSAQVGRVHFVLDGTHVIDSTFDGSHMFASLPAGAHALSGFLERADGSAIAGSEAEPISFSTTTPDTTNPVVIGTLNGHDVLGDSSTHKIISWLSPQDSAYDQAIDVAWDFLLNRVPNDVNGLKAYFTNSYLNSGTLEPSGWMHNPAHLYASIIDSALAYYAYSGDSRVITLARSMADYHLENGMTPDGWAWSRVPYSSSCGNCPTYDANRTEDTPGHIEPDKVGEFGIGLIRLYEFTGDVRYRDAAIASADALATHVRPGDATHSPWPFRVDALNNAPREEYTANVIRPIGLFDELIRLNLGNVASYRAARTIGLAWLFAYPMQTNVWSNYFEDVPVQTDLGNYNQYIPMETAYYLMRHPEVDPDWRTHVPALVRWVETNFAEPQFGANAIREQLIFHFAMGSHTSRYAAVNALYSELTGDAAARDKAYRALNWATYMVSLSPQGQIIDGPDVRNVWFTDGYGDYIRHFLRGMGAVPEWAPNGESHLTRSSSIVTAINYSASEITYMTADSDATDILKVAFMPVEVAAGGVLLARRTDLDAPGWVYDAATKVLKIRHAQAAVRISAAADTAAPVITEVAASGVSDRSAIVSWTTNEPADSQVEYGQTASYGSMTALDGSRVTAHAAAISGLLPATVYHYRVISRDAAGNLAGSGDSTFTTTGPDVAPPAVSITAPTGGSTVSGAAVTLRADATDDVGVVSVQFMVDGAPVGAPQTVAPYSVNWDSTGVANGTHIVSADAVDAAGNMTASAVVTVTVDNNVLQVVDFNELTDPNRPLNGEYPAGVIDWGSGAWFLSGPVGPLPTNSISMTESVTSASVTFITPRRLISLVAFNVASSASTVTLSCSGNPVATASVAPNEVATISTGWIANCSDVTIESSNGWDTNFDDLTFDIAR
jgi:hypothetical protein